MADPQLNIEIISDVICPWCYIGKKRLERALEIVPGIDPVLTWRPYLLEPQISEEGMNRQAYIESKYSKEEASGLFDALAETGSAVGIHFAFEQIERMPNSFDAHRLIHWAKEQDCQDDIVENLFHTFFVEGGDIGDRQLLCDLAAISGLDSELVSVWLETNRDVDQIDKSIRQATDLGIKAIPTLVINQLVLLTGVESPELLAQAFVKIADNSTIRE